MRTLDDIIPPSRRQGGADMPPPPPPRSPRVGGRRFPYITAVIALVVVAAVVGVLYYFSGATVQITLNQESVDATGSYSASSSGSELTFEVVSAQKVASQSVASSGTKSVSSIAQGTIVISNTGAKAQTLIAKTRFATSDGLIFRIHTPVTVPAAKGSTPGSISATVYAEQAGSQYNVGPTTFVVPGFLPGSPDLYKAVTAKSSAAMSGGASGNEPAVDPSVAVATRASLASALAADLDAAIKAQVPDGYVLLAGSATTTYQDQSPTPSKTSGMVDFHEQGTITAVVFPSIALARAIVAESGAGADLGDSAIENPGSITLTPAKAFPRDGDSSFAFTLSGSAALRAAVDQNQVAAAVAGKTRTEAQTALRSFPAIREATLVLRPFWENSFPQDPARIKVLFKEQAGN